MKKKVRWSLFSLFSGLLLIFSSCTIGMGEEVDLEAPVLTITSPQKFSYQKNLSFTLEGTCTDNKGITSVVISNKETGKIYGNADVVGDNWSFNVTLEKEEEGEVTFLCSANDAFQNSSTKSARTITLLVDEHAPEGLAWYLDRGNHIQTPLKEKEELENLDYTLAVNKDVPQNQQFTLYGSFYDAMSIYEITVSLYDDTISPDTPVISKTLRSDPSDVSHYIGDGNSIYSPGFTFTHSELAGTKPALASGKHYLRVKYYSKDNNTATNFNEATVDTELYILWWPESDKPGIQQTQIENDRISVSVGSSLPVDFFDDDAIQEAYWAIKSTIPSAISTFEANLISTPSVRTTAFPANPGQNESVQHKVFSNTTTRDFPTTITAPDIPAQMYLVTCAQDIGGKWNARVIPLEVTDSQKPMLFIESPVENTIPTMVDSSNFQIKGYSLDTKGSDYIKIVYVPDSSGSTSAEKEARAKQLLETYASDKSAKKVISGTNEVIWYQKFTGEDFSSGWNKQQFTISMNLLQDFKNSSGQTTAKASKFFEILTVDTDGNQVFKPYILGSDVVVPYITFVTPNKDLAVHDYSKNELVFKFKGEKSSGLTMDTSKYKVTTKIGNTTYEYTTSSNPKITVSDGYANLTIPKATLATWAQTEPQPTFTFYATDVLGNGGAGEGQRSVIFGENPYITGITIDKNSGTYKKGDVLKFKVSFNKQVKVIGSPRLLIKFASGDTTSKPAPYASGSGSNALFFKYTVGEGDSSQGIICTGFDIASENVLANSARICATELGEGDIYTTLANATATTGGGVLKDKTIKLDGVLPRISNITITPDDGIAACTKDKQINAEVVVSENVLVSGSPELLVKVNNQNVKFTFQKMVDNKITFIHTVTNSDPEGGASAIDSSSFTSAHAAYITDNAGNALALPASGSAHTYNSSVVIDYTPPATAPTTNLTASLYNEAKTVELSGYETGDTSYYSKDGGVSWTTYNPSDKETLGDGTYYIATYREDAAGNRSSSSAVNTVIIKGNFAEVTNFSVDAADGYYAAGSNVTFTLDYAEDVKIGAATAAKLTFEDINDSTKTKTVNVTVPSGGQTSSLKFNYTVGTTDEFKGIKVTKIVFDSTVEDTYGNKPSYSGTANTLTPTNCTYLNATDGGKRSGINLDGVAPVISTYVPANGGISSITDNSSGSFKITLTFSENVFKETGYIILQRKGDWAIPAVLENNEFLKYYNKMSAANKAIVRRMGSDGDDLKHGRTGMEVGPYRRTTHGLIKDGSYYIPDTSTKFVLAYDLGLYEGSAALNDGTETGTFTVTVAQIRAALESVGYHQHKVDVASEYVKITGNKVEITFSEKIEDGREWELIIPDTAFRDDAENFYKGMNITGSTDTYSMWSNNVAQPVIRVDRYTHGWGAKEPNSDGSFTTITVNQGKYNNANPANNTAAKIAPTGYARARIDCETPGAAIKYSKLGINGTAWTTTAPAGVAYNATGGTSYTFNNDGIAVTTGNNNNKYTRQVLDDITTTAINKRGAQSYTQGNDIIIGDGNYTAARKDYITAYATKSGYTDSVNGYEGVFKTIVYYTAGSQTRIINVEGGTAPGGQACVFGFPLKDATDENDPTNAGRYSKNCYAVNGNTRTQWAFVSYEIMSKDWAILLCNGNHSRIYPLNSYGGATYITAMNYW